MSTGLESLLLVAACHTPTVLDGICTSDSFHCLIKFLHIGLLLLYAPDNTKYNRKCGDGNDRKIHSVVSSYHHSPSCKND